MSQKGHAQEAASPIGRPHATLSGHDAFLIHNPIENTWF